jgi:hypothetical protein
MTARLTLALALLASACSNNNLNGNGNDGSVPDDASVGDMAMAPTGDMTGMAGMCNPVTQNCTDPTMPKCELVVTGTGMMRMIGGQCTTDGTAARDTACTVDMTTGEDDCVKGTRCTSRGLATGAQAVCRKYCAADTDCGAGQACISALGGAGGGGGGGGGGMMTAIGTCAPSCTPFGTDCGTGNTCATEQTDIASTMTKPKRFLTCRASGSKALWDTCTAATDCGDNAVCVRQTQLCTPLCDDSNACPNEPDMTDAGTGPTTTSCMPAGLPNNGGVCG